MMDYFNFYKNYQINSKNEDNLFKNENIINLPNSYNSLNYLEKDDSLLFSRDKCGLNNICIDNISNVLNNNQILEVIFEAKKKKMKISISATMYTMGTHSIIKNGIMINMKYMNKINNFNFEDNSITVEAGMKWTDLISFVNIYGLTPEDLPLFCSTTIGGTISTNCHTLNGNFIHNSIISMKIITLNGNILQCSSTQNKEIYSLVIGGFGLFGIISEVTLKLVKNTGLKFSKNTINLDKLNKKFEEIDLDKNIIIKYGLIDLQNFNKIQFYIFENDKTKKVSELNKNNPNSKILFSSISGKNQRNIFKHETNKIFYDGSLLISKYYKKLKKNNKTIILQEYFIPFDLIESWIKFLKCILKNKPLTKIHLLSIKITKLSGNNFSFLKINNSFVCSLFFKIKINEKTVLEMHQLNNYFTEYCLKIGGQFHLPYIKNYTFNQLYKSYPSIIEWQKNKYYVDSECILTNNWFHDFDNQNLYKPINNFLFDKSPVKKILLGNVNFLNCEESNNNFKTVFDNQILKIKLEFMLKKFLNLNEFNNIINLINQELNKNQTDDLIKSILQNSINSHYYLNKLKTYFNRKNDNHSIIFNKLLNKISKKQNFNNWLNIGFFPYLTNINVSGKIYNLHNTRAYFGSLIKYNHIWFDYNKINLVNNFVNNGSIDLITCFEGLNKILPNKLKKILTMINNLLCINGLFFLKEYNGYNDLKPFLSSLHDIQNIIFQTECNERHTFRSLEEWILIIENFGFKNISIFCKQPNDVSENYMTCFVKIKNIEPMMDFEDHIMSKKDQYFQKPIVSFSNLPYKNFNDNLIDYLTEPNPEKFNKFLCKNPIKLCWLSFFKELIIVKKYFGYGNLFNKNTLINGIVCSINSIIFLQLAFISKLKKKVNNQNYNTRKIIIYKKKEIKIDLQNLDQNIVLLASQMKNHISHYLIEVPYSFDYSFQLIDIIGKLINNGIGILEVNGQKKILVKIKSKNEISFFETNVIDITKFFGSNCIIYTLFLDVIDLEKFFMSYGNLIIDIII